MARYRISRRETLLHGSIFIPGGSELPDGIFNQKQIDEHIRTGFLVEIKSDKDNEKRDLGVPTGAIPLKTEIKDDGRVLRMSDPSKAKQPTRGKWAADPADLKTLTLEDLNLRIAGIDHEVEPFETKEEAIAHLSQDFR